MEIKTVYLKHKKPTLDIDYNKEIHYKKITRFITENNDIFYHVTGYNKHRKPVFNLSFNNKERYTRLTDQFNKFKPKYENKNYTVLSITENKINDYSLF